MTRRKDGITCTATNREGNQCGNPPIPGGTVCIKHGGKAPQVQQAASRRILDGLVGPALRELRDLLNNPNTPPHVKLAAARDVLDRTGHKPPERVEVLTMDLVEQRIMELEQELIAQDD